MPDKIKQAHEDGRSLWRKFEATEEAASERSTAEIAAPSGPFSGPSGSASVLWSQALRNDYYHAIPAADHDPNATGWIALCGSFCCGTPLMVEETEGREACKTCLHLSSLHPLGSGVPTFALYEFNPRRAQRGAEAASVRVTWPDGEQDLLWMCERDVLHNRLKFGDSPGLREVLRAYESGERVHPQNVEVTDAKRSVE